MEKTKSNGKQLKSVVKVKSKSSGKIGKISSEDLWEASTSNWENPENNPPDDQNLARASFMEENDHVDMTVGGINEEFLSEIETDSDSDGEESVKIVVSQKQLDKWRKINRMQDRDELLNEIENCSTPGE